MQLVTLKNGLRIAKISKPASETAALLLMVKAGSRYEGKDIWGVAHFLEHMVFKGTKKRPSTLELSEYLDKIGGDYNAFTGNEYTGFHAHVAAKHLVEALDFLTDLVGQPLFKPADFVMEKGVILEEINLYEDMPIHQVDDLFSEAIFGDDSLAHRIAGGQSTISKMKLEDLKNFYQKYYTPSNMILSIVANEKILNGFEKQVEKVFYNSGPKPEKASTSEIKKDGPRVKILKKPIQQGNLIIGFEGAPYSSADRFPLILLSALLGGMMSSRMFINIREKLGLCYYIKTQHQSFETTGVFATQAGVDTKNLTKAIRAILSEYRIIKERKVVEEELNKTKEYIKGRMALNIEDSEELASIYAYQLTLADKALSPAEIYRKIDSVTADDILKVARKYLDRQTLSLAVVAPKADEVELKELVEGYQ